ncbi:MAG: GHMP family kinase ATP-binding protein, partial [Planctomycetota bacterium]
MTSPRPQRLLVPVSTSNVGPGFDAFSIALDAQLSLQWQPAAKTTLVREQALEESPLRLSQDPIIRGMRRASILANQPLPTGEIRASSPIAHGRGLGLSGSGLVAGLMLGNRLCGNHTHQKELLEEAIHLEGNPENAVGAMLGGAHWSIRGPKQDWIHHPVALHRNLRFLLVIPPYPMTTKRSREALPTSVSFARAMRQAHRPPILL